MTEDPASLQNLNDIVLPAPVSFWPLDTGGLLILAGLLFSLTVIGFQYYLRYRKNRYRRAGLALLESATSVRDVSVALKRVALAVYSREKVASLYAAEWIEFLNDTCSGANFDSDEFEYPGRPTDAGLTRKAKRWITAHRATDKESRDS